MLAMGVTGINSFLRRVFWATILLVSLIAIARGQEPEAAPTPKEKPKAILVDDIGDVGDCEFVLRVRKFNRKLSENPSYQGYIINYESAKGPPDLDTRERLIANNIASGTYDRSRITLVRGGFRLEISTELWMVPPEAENPAPSSTLPDQPSGEPDTFLYETTYPSLDAFALPSADGEREPDETNEPDEGTPQREEDTRYGWVPLGFASRLSIVENTATGLIRFYADDRKYDIARATAFIDSARPRLAKYGRMDPRRFHVEFGGYRPSPQVEFWVVRAGASSARVRAYERCGNPDQ